MNHLGRAGVVEVVVLVFVVVVVRHLAGGWGRVGGGRGGVDRGRGGAVGGVRQSQAGEEEEDLGGWSVTLVRRDSTGDLQLVEVRRTLLGTAHC